MSDQFIPIKQHADPAALIDGINSVNNTLPSIIPENVPVKYTEYLADPSNPEIQYELKTYGYNVLDDTGNIDPVKNHLFVKEQVENDILFPTGYHLLIMTWTGTAYEEALKHTTIVLPESMKGEKKEEKDWYESRLGLVLRRGSQSYQANHKFQGTQWCQPGDFVFIRFHDKSLIRIHGEKKKYHYMFFTTDERIQCVVKNPKLVDTQTNYT